LYLIANFQQEKKSTTRNAYMRMFLLAIVLYWIFLCAFVLYCVSFWLYTMPLSKHTYWTIMYSRSNIDTIRENRDAWKWYLVSQRYNQWKKISSTYSGKIIIRQYPDSESTSPEYISTLYCEFVEQKNIHTFFSSRLPV
jgi:hypothetical protein